MSIQAMKQALEALGYGYDAARCTSAFDTIRNAEAALRAAIEAAEKQEPVAWLHSVRQDSDVITTAVKHLWGRVPVAVGKEAQYTIPLYTHPQPAIPEWQPIETAPRDGTYFICFNGNWRGLSRYWEPNYEDDPIWVDETTEFISPPPTHWMPLPAAPKPENSHD